MGLPSNSNLKKHEDRALLDGVDPFYIKQMRGGLTGVVGVMEAKSSASASTPTIALRFDIDSLDMHESDSDEHYPAQENFRSVYEGMMHACGHDGHAAIRLGVAKLLALNKKNMVLRHFMWI
tara:strand:+ start:2659 stop:3024 length:366 start_codon:yes stop_codon:yes gene_type:complete